MVAPTASNASAPAKSQLPELPVRASSARPASTDAGSPESVAGAVVVGAAVVVVLESSWGLSPVEVTVTTAVSATSAVLSLLTDTRLVSTPTWVALRVSSTSVEAPAARSPRVHVMLLPSIVPTGELLKWVRPLGRSLRRVIPVAGLLPVLVMRRSTTVRPPTGISSSVMDWVTDTVVSATWAGPNEVAPSRRGSEDEVGALSLVTGPDGGTESATSEKVPGAVAGAAAGAASTTTDPTVARTAMSHAGGRCRRGERVTNRNIPVPGALLVTPSLTVGTISGVATHSADLLRLSRYR